MDNHTDSNLIVKRKVSVSQVTGDLMSLIHYSLRCIRMSGIIYRDLSFQEVRRYVREGVLVWRTWMYIHYGSSPGSDTQTVPIVCTRVCRIFVPARISSLRRGHLLASISKRFVPTTGFPA
jgi:hypothetical protein